MNLPSPDGRGSVTGAPNLPAGFTDTFTSRYVDTGDVRLHAVIGGDGPPLLLVHGWPETWYAWRLLMPALARDFKVIAVDQRGIGLSDKPHGRVRHRHPRRRPGRADGRARPRAVRRGRPRHRIRDRLRAGRGSPGPGRPRGARRDPRAAGAAPSPPVFVPEPSTTGSGTSRSTGSRGCPSNSSQGREDIYFGYEFAVQGGTLPAESIAYYVASSPTPTRCAAASGSTGRSTPPSRRTTSARASRWRCRCWRSAARRATATTSAEAMKASPSDVQSVVIPGAGHWVAEEAPDEMLAALTAVPGALPRLIECCWHPPGSRTRLMTISSSDAARSANETQVCVATPLPAQTCCRQPPRRPRRRSCLSARCTLRRNLRHLGSVMNIVDTIRAGNEPEQSLRPRSELTARGFARRWAPCCA